MKLWITFSLTLLTACAVERPMTDLCVINAETLSRKCYNMHDDYDSSGKLLPGAIPKIRSNATVQDLNKAVVIDSPTGFEDGWANLKAYINKLKKKLKEAARGNN